MGAGDGGVMIGMLSWSREMRHKIPRGSGCQSEDTHVREVNLHSTALGSSDKIMNLSFQGHT